MCCSARRMLSKFIKSGHFDGNAVIEEQQVFFYCFRLHEGYVKNALLLS